jgi:uncharacterized membrane protein
MAAADKREFRIHEFFEVGIILKGANALVEFVLGVLFLFVNVSGIVQALVQNELVEDPNDFLATHLQSITGTISPQTQFFAALYLLSHGIIKGVLVVGLLRDKMWAYPASLAVLSLFIVYQVISFLGSHSIPLALLTLFDLVVIWLIWHEYRLKIRSRA